MSLIQSNGEVNFSSTEEDTGNRWTDGKSIYRKTIDCSAISNSGSLLTGVSTMVNSFGQFSNGTSFFSAPYQDGTNAVYPLLSSSGAVTLVRSGSFATARTGDTITIYYTKS